MWATPDIHHRPFGKLWGLSHPSILFPESTLINSHVFIIFSLYVIFFITDESCAGTGSPPAKCHCPGNSNYICKLHYMKKTLSTGLQNIHTGELMTSEVFTMCK